MSTPGITGYPGGPYSTNSTKKYVPVVILDAILVPDLRKDTVLLSPRALFCLQGVKVYFNDELHLLLPNGSKVYLAETETAYMIELSDPISPPRRSILSANVDAGQRLERLEILFEHNGSSLQYGLRSCPRPYPRPVHVRFLSTSRRLRKIRHTGLDLAAIARPATVGHERDQATAPLKAKPS